MATAPGLHAAFTKLAALVSDEMIGVVDCTSMATSCVAETWAEFVAVKATEYWPTCDVVGDQLNTPVLGLKLESGGRLATDRTTVRPAGSLAETVNVTNPPGVMVCRPGTVSAGGAGVNVTEACTAMAWYVALTVTD